MIININLGKMKKQHHNPTSLKQDKEEKNDFPDYPTYPPSDDIYNKFHEETEINPEDITKKKESVKNENIGELNIKDFEADKSASDLDIPGSELDDELENTGNEDEENNFYSIGGDNHNNLEENGSEAEDTQPERKIINRKKS